MLKLTAQNLMVEVQDAIDFRREHTDESKKQIELMAGDAYRSSWTPSIKGDVNHPFEFSSNILPALVYSNPKVKITSRRPRAQRELVGAMQHGLNRWIADVDLKRVLRRIALDTMFDFGIALVTMEALPGYENKRIPPMRPCVKRISPRRYFEDPRGGISGPRFMGHALVRDKEDLLKAKNPDGSPVYDQKILEQLNTNTEELEFREDELDDSLKASRPSRDQVVIYEVYVPETKMIYCLSMQPTENKKGKAVFIRKPRKAFCPPAGPYVRFGIYDVPDQVYPLAPLAATAAQVEEINAHRAQTRRQADTARRLLLVDAAQQALVEAVTTYKDGTVAAIPGFNRNLFAEVDLGGPSKESLNYVQILSAELQRTSGLTDMMRGQISGATATEVNEASAGQDTRVRYMQDRFRESVADVLNAAAWFMFESHSIVFPVPQAQAARSVFEWQKEEDDTDQEDGIFLGGVQPGQEDFTFSDLELEIQPYSMEMVDQVILQRRMQTAFQVLMSAAPMIIQTPYLNWPAILDDYFEALNIPDGRKYIDWRKLEEMMQAQFTPGQPQQIPGLDGTPPVDTKAFKAPPNMPPPNQQEEADPGAAGGGRTFELAGILGQGSAA